VGATAGAGGTGDPSVAHGACDFRAVSGTCVEITADLATVSVAQMTCVMGAGIWSEDPCPATADLVGCCAYTTSSLYRDCTYQGAPGGNPQAACSLITGSVWTPREAD
jgi:hypothetical protein